MARTRAKFRCDSVQDHGWNKTVRLSVVYSRKEGEENYDFTKATPNGTIEMSIDNLAAAVQFKPQHFYYVDFIECPAEQQPDLDGDRYQHKPHKPENLNPA